MLPPLFNYVRYWNSCVAEQPFHSSPVTMDSRNNSIFPKPDVSDLGITPSTCIPKKSSRSNKSNFMQNVGEIN